MRRGEWESEAGRGGGCEFVKSTQHQRDSNSFSRTNRVATLIAPVLSRQPSPSYSHSRHPVWTHDAVGLYYSSPPVGAASVKLNFDPGGSSRIH